MSRRKQVLLAAVLIAGLAVAFIGGVVWSQSPRGPMRRTLREIRGLPERVRDREPV